MKGKPIRSIFWALLAVFCIVVIMIFMPGLIRQSGRFMLYGLISTGVVFLLLGIDILVLTTQQKISEKLKKFLLLTGSCAAGLPVFAVLYNLAYALFIKWFGADFWGAMGEEPFFFILATMVCPISFLVGIVGTVVLDVRSKHAVPDVRT